MTGIPRYTILILALCLLPLVTSAQHGTIIYDHTVTFDFEIPEEVKSMKIEGLSKALEEMPEERTTQKTLKFTATSTLMEPVEESNDGTVITNTVMASPSGRRVEMTQMKAGVGSVHIAFSATGAGSSQTTATFVDLDEATYTEQRTFMGRSFLVSGDQESLAWRLPGEERMLLGYQIVKATAMKDTVAIEAWFAPEIPVSGGPELFGGLPGMILVLSIDGGHELYTAVELDLETAPEFEAPDKGRSVSAAEFDQIVADKKEEVEKTRGGRRGDMNIIVRRQ